jgi:hypothetical protein
VIIGEALKRLINGVEVDLTIGGNAFCRTINFHYGDHKELVKWIADKKRNKYPLVWYVINPYTEEPDGYKNVKSRLLIFQSTEVEWFNSKRSVKSYDEVIEPVWQKVKSLLASNNYVQVMGDLQTKYRIKDEPSYGVETDGIRLGQTDFTNKKQKGTQSITLDVVDGRIIELNLRIKTNCIK